MDGRADIVEVSKPHSLYRNVAIIVGSILLFFLSIQMMGVSFHALGKDVASSIFDATSNPFIGLFIGLLITAILQSSSTTTTMTVAAVASGSLTLYQAIPIVLGANIGTTLTSTIVSLSYITRNNEFRKAISAGTVHDIYNVLVVLLIFPLELNYGFLSRLSEGITQNLPLLSGSIGFTNPFNHLLPLENAIINSLGSLVTLLLSFALLLATVKYISNILYKEWIGTASRKFETAFFNNKYKSFGWGLIITAIIQSSSLSTSLMVPLVATGKLKIGRAFQFILGSNLGTTITALLAALFQSEAALSLAIAHFIFNLFGVSLFLFIPFLSGIPTYLSEHLGNISLRSKAIGFAYILFTFFILPFTLIYFSNNNEWNVKVERNADQVIEKREALLED